MIALNEFMARLRTGDSLEFNRLKITPLFVDEDRPLPFLDLEDAIKQGFVVISEVSEGGSVPQLEVANKSDADVLILDGEELIGAKQNRIVNTTIIVPATTSLTIPVSCVQQRRWHYTSRNFETSKSVAYASLRRKKHEHVSESLRSFANYTTDQAMIWDDVERKAARMATPTDSLAMSDIYEQSIDSSDEQLRHEIPHLEKQVGFLAFINGNFAGGEVFGSAELCGKKLQKLLRSYYLDSLDPGVEFPAVSVEQVLAQVQNANHAQFESIGKGTELRFEAATVQGSWKLVDDVIPHLLVFPKVTNN